MIIVKEVSLQFSTILYDNGSEEANFLKRRHYFFFNTIFVLSHMYPENPEGTQVIVGSVNMGYISYSARNRTHNLFRPKREPIPLGHSDGQIITPQLFT